MNIEKVKNKISSYKGQTLSFQFNGSRNQIEKFEATVVGIYPSIFIVRVEDSSQVKSFSYNDVLIKKLVMSEVL